jgi:hypothetical protein
MPEKKRFSDFAKGPDILDGEKVRIESILNQEIEIIGHRIADSKYSKNTSGKCLTLQFKRPNGDRRVVFTGSDVLISQMAQYAEEIPFLATVKKIDRYYTLT